MNEFIHGVYKTIIRKLRMLHASLYIIRALEEAEKYLVQLRLLQSEPDQVQGEDSSKDAAALQPQPENAKPSTNTRDQQTEGDDAAGAQLADIDPYMDAPIAEEDDVETYSQASDYAMALWVKGLGADAERSGDMTPTEPESEEEVSKRVQDMNLVGTPPKDETKATHLACNLRALVQTCLSCTCMHAM